MNDSPNDRPPMPPAYTTLLERLVLPTQLEDIHRTLTRAFDLDAQKHSEHDESVLRILLCIRLAPAGAIRAKDISIQLVKSTSHTSRLIDRAEARHLVERRADPTDRRAHSIALTPLGTKAIDAYVPHAAAMLGEAFADVLTPEELGVLLSLVGRVQSAASRFVDKTTDRHQHDKGEQPS